MTEPSSGATAPNGARSRELPDEASPLASLWGAEARAALGPVSVAAETEGNLLSPGPVCNGMKPSAACLRWLLPRKLSQRTGDWRLT